LDAGFINPPLNKLSNLVKDYSYQILKAIDQSELAQYRYDKRGSLLFSGINYTHEDKIYRNHENQKKQPVRGVRSSS
jgi:hypothetical protein